MKKMRLFLCLVGLVRFCAVAQGTFQDLDFEQAAVVPTYVGSPVIWAANAFPGWTVYFSGFPQTEVALNQVLALPVGLGDLASPNLVLDGSFSAVLAGSALSAVATAIGQSGTIPPGSQSLTFLSFEQFSVSFAGHSLPLQLLGEGPNASQMYGADISAYAGQYGQLLFQTAPGGGQEILDDIAFSTQSIPEPGMFSIIALGALLLCQRRLGRRARSPARYRA